MSVPVVSPALAASPPGIGDLCFLSPEWVHAYRIAAMAAVAKNAAGLQDLGQFTYCRVGHNPPWHSSPYGEAYKSQITPYTAPEKGPGRQVYGNKLAMWMRFKGGTVEVHPGELPASECDFKVQGDHGVMSRLARVLHGGVDPRVTAAAHAQLIPQSKWVKDGKFSEHKVLVAILTQIHDAMAPRTIPRAVWMTPDWASFAREIITTRANHPDLQKNSKGEVFQKDFEFIFSEEFTNPPRYASPDGSSGGFWVVFKHGQVTVGCGALPAEYGEPDMLTKGQYIPILGGGRTVNAALNKEEQAMVAEHSKKTPPIFNGQRTMIAVQKVKKGSPQMPMPMGLCMLPLHDELSLRSSGEIPSDFDPNVQDRGAPPFDRSPEYQGTWLRYDQVDVYGQPLAHSKL